MQPEISAVATLGWVARYKAIAAKSSPYEAMDWLTANRVGERIKAAIGSGPPLSALDPYGISLGQWSDTARTRSAFYRMLADGAFTRLPMYVHAAMVTTSATGALTPEGRAAAVSRIVLSNITLTPQKVTALIVCSETLLREVSAAGQQLFNRELLGAISDAVDAAFLSAVINQAPAITPITSSAPMADLRAAMAAVNFVGQARPYWLAHPTTAGIMSTLTAAKGGAATNAASLVGGELANLPLLTSTGIAPGSLYLIDASGIVVDAMPPTVDVSSEADIQMDTAPTMDSTVPTATSMVSIFTTNSVAMLASAFFSALRLRANAIAVVNGINATTWAP